MRVSRKSDAVTPASWLLWRDTHEQVGKSKVRLKRRDYRQALYADAVAWSKMDKAKGERVT